MELKRATAAVLLILLSITCLACDRAVPPTRNPVEEGKTNINLSAITGSNQIQAFSEVKQASLLPKAVLGRMGGLAGPGEPFNATDVIDLILPMRKLVAAAVSQQYCIVTYWQGGIALSMQTAIFELSGNNARMIWLSRSQGGLNFDDLKKMVESGRMHNDLARQR